MNAEGLYGALFKAFGPQGWWPIASLAGKKGFGPFGYHKGDYSYPRDSAQEQEIIIGAILTQNTSWKNVEKAIENLKAAGLLGPGLASASMGEIEECVRPSGYYRQKARRLQGLAGKIPPYERDYLLSLKGIGPETADSILLYAGKQLVFPVDAYTARICRRLGMCEGGYSEIQDYFHKNLEKNLVHYNEMHALLVALAKGNCTKREPLCDSCPVSKECPSVGTQK